MTITTKQGFRNKTYGGRREVKAIVVHQFGGPEVLKLEETAKNPPGRGQVLVRIKAAGVNPVDTYIRAGVYARKPELPYTPGTDGTRTCPRPGDRKSTRLNSSHT